MANIKNITKKLVDAGYSEEKLILMTEKEIREVYKNYKSSPKEDDSILSSPNTTPENNDNANKEETTMKNEMIKEMKKLARKYDAFTHCIEDCRQREEAEKRNETLGVKFVEVANKIGINATANDLYEIISNDYDSFDEAIEAYIKSHDVRVVSATLTQENGELTFVELSSEQKLEISAVLDAQLQDVNYSSWFEEENGIFKLYGGWVDEDSVVEEEYYFDDTNKLIKVEKEESTMKNNTNTTATNNSATVVKEEITMRELVNNTINRIETATKVQDAKYVTRDELAGIMEQITGVRPGKKVTRKQMVQDLYVLEDDLQQMENANGSDCDSDTVVAVGDFCNDHAPESIESDPTPVVENPAPVSDAKAKTVEVLKLIKEAAVTNHNKGFGTTVSAYMLCAYILQAGYGIKKLKGHEAEITDEQKDTVKRVRQWLIDKGYIKACVYKTNGKSVYTDDYDGNHAASMVHHSKSLGLTCVGVSSYKVCF